MGRIVSINKHTTNMIYTIEDQSGSSIEARRWSPEATTPEKSIWKTIGSASIYYCIYTSNGNAHREGELVRVMGNLRFLNNKRFLNAVQMRRPMAEEEYEFHQLEVEYVTRFYKFGPVCPFLRLSFAPLARPCNSAADAWPECFCCRLCLELCFRCFSLHGQPERPTIGWSI